MKISGDNLLCYFPAAQFYTSYVKFWYVMFRIGLFKCESEEITHSLNMQINMTMNMKTTVHANYGIIGPNPIKNVIKIRQCCNMDRSSGTITVALRFRPVLQCFTTEAQ